MLTFKISVMIAGALVLVMLAVRILVWQWRPQTRPCRWFGHDKKYVAIKISGCVPLNSPESNGRPFTCNHGHKIGDNGIYIARWVCTRCPEMVEECLGSGKDWKIEHEKLVPDVKKWANWSVPPPDPIEAAREKLKAIQERIGKPDPEDKQKDQELRDCKACGAEHTGPCVPGAIS